MSTFNQLVAELSNDARRVRPEDALQFCANWFRTRLENQRTRTRSVLARRFSAISELPVDHFLDTPLPSHPMDEPIAPNAASPRDARFDTRRATMPHLYAASPFGTLDVPGNALLEDHLATPRRKSSCLLDSDESVHRRLSKVYEEPTILPRESFSFGSGTRSSFSVPSDGDSPTVTMKPGDYLHPPSANLLARRGSISAESLPIGDGMPPAPLPVYPKSDAQLARIRSAISANFIFRDLDDEQTAGVLAAMQEQHVTPDELVVRQGDVGEYFYVVESGLLHCYIRPEPLPAHWLATSGPTSTLIVAETQIPHGGVSAGWHPELGRHVATCTSGTSFGELALMYGHPRAASVLALEPTTLWAVDRTTFRTIILGAAHRRRTMYEGFLADVPLLASLAPDERAKVADALVSKVYEDGDPVVRQGEPSAAFFFIEEGSAAVLTASPDSDGGCKQPIEVGRLMKGQYFGGKSYLPYFTWPS
jgi:cAMP-dependent protein kinase regulator